MEKEIFKNNNFYGIKEDGSFDMEVFNEEPVARLSPSVLEFKNGDLIILAKKEIGIFPFDQDLLVNFLAERYASFKQLTGINLESHVFTDAFCELQVMAWENRKASTPIDNEDMLYALAQLVIDMYLDDEDLENLSEYTEEKGCDCDRCKEIRAEKEQE